VKTSDFTHRYQFMAQQHGHSYKDVFKHWEVVPINYAMSHTL